MSDNEAGREARPSSYMALNLLIRKHLTPIFSPCGSVCFRSPLVSTKATYDFLS